MASRGAVEPATDRHGVVASYELLALARHGIYAHSVSRPRGSGGGRPSHRPQVKLWDVFEARVLESLECNKDCLALAYRPDGDELCVSVLGGSLLLWNTKDGTLARAIAGAHDVSGKRQASP